MVNLGWIEGIGWVFEPLHPDWRVRLFLGQFNGNQVPDNSGVKVPCGHSVAFQIKMDHGGLVPALVMVIAHRKVRDLSLGQVDGPYGGNSVLCSILGVGWKGLLDQGTPDCT